MVKAPVAATLAMTLPVTEPISALDTTAVMAGPPSSLLPVSMPT